MGHPCMISSEESIPGLKSLSTVLSKGPASTRTHSSSSMNGEAMVDTVVRFKNTASWRFKVVVQEGFPRD